MFNLLIFNVRWDTGRAIVPLERMFGFTDEVIINRFRAENRPLLNDLIPFPCLFCEEGNADEIAYVGKINQARIAGRNIHLEFTIDTEVPPLQNSDIYASREALDIHDEFEFSRNHWAVKDVDLYRFLLRNARPRRRRPIVFELPEHESIDPTLMSAMMPFNARFNAVYEAIRQAAHDAGMRCQRADDIWENAQVIQDVVSLIDRSRIVVCDCTDRNPNVFYEAGIAHALGREVILITQNEGDIPFDLRHLRYIRYLDNGEGRGALVQSLSARIQTVVGE